MPLWLAPVPVVLASKSSARRALLESAGLPLEIVPADIDERAVEADAGIENPAGAARLLAREKARAVATRKPGRFVFGADQTLSLGDRRFSKASDRAGARIQLAALRGRTHLLHSAVAVARDGNILFENVADARLTMRTFSDDFLENYLDTIGSAAFASVGAYQLEGAGIQLFEKIEGDYATILGLPLLPLLAWLRELGLLAK
jgi:septum formation protein